MDVGVTVAGMGRDVEIGPAWRGCAARTWALLDMATPAAREASRTLRRLSMISLPVLLILGSWTSRQLSHQPGSRCASLHSCSTRSARGREPSTRTTGQGKLREPRLIFCETTAVAIAGFVVRGPVDERLRLLMTPAALCDGIRSEMRSLAVTQALQAKLARRRHKDDEIEEWMNSSPQPVTVPLSTQSSRGRNISRIRRRRSAAGRVVWAGGRRRQPEIIIAVVMRQRKPAGERAADRRHAGAGGSHQMDAAAFHRHQARRLKLLPRRRAQAVPGVADLVVMHLGQIVRRVEAERLDVEPADRAEQRIGGDHAVARAPISRALAGIRSCCELSTSTVVRWPPAPRAARPAARRSRRELRTRGRDRDLGAFVGTQALTAAVRA